jgi:hypothetical protein
MKKVFSVFFAVALCVNVIPASATSILGSKPICKPGDPVVWENTNTKVYHLSGDKYYGNTKKGAYACRSAADGAGYHVSGQKGASGTTTAKTKKTAGAMGGAMGAAATAMPKPMSSAMAMPMASASPMGKKRRKHSKSAMTGAAASPAPMTSATPAAKHRKRHKKGSTASPSPAAT